MVKYGTPKKQEMFVVSCKPSYLPLISTSSSVLVVTFLTANRSLTKNAILEHTNDSHDVFILYFKYFRHLTID